MKVEIKVPSPGESITEATIANWLVDNGDQVEKDQEIVEIDSDKATLAISADESGKIDIKVEAGETVEVGSVIATIDTEAEGKKADKKDGGEKKKEEKESAEAKEEPEKAEQEQAEKTEEKESKEIEKPAGQEKEKPAGEKIDMHISPLARKLMKEKDVSEEKLVEFFKNLRVSKADVEFYLENKDKISEKSAPQPQVQSWGGGRETESKRINTFRKKLSQRLVSVKNETAMLTTFNEVNMTPIVELRKKHKDDFREKYGVGLGFMSFFTKAVTEALNHFPQVNAQIHGDEMIFHKYADIGIAVSAPKGLMVPVIRNAETLSFAEIEQKIKELAIKARDGKLSLDEMEGGTFTITNGGVFGSMLSTPILNPPQSAILGMHNILDRPIAVNGKVEIHPVMYVALSYDHRIIDGKESVSFLYKIKEMLEDPVQLMMGGNDPGKAMLGL